MIAFEPIMTVGLGPVQISTHGGLIALGFLVAFLLARREVKKKGLSVELVDSLGSVLLVAGFIGARVVYVATLGRDLSFFEMLKVWEGGLSSHGGYVFAVLAGIWYVRRKKQSVLPYADVLFPYMLLGWAIGRIGDLVSWGEGGVPAQVAWAFIIDGVPRHPTQIYETLGYLDGFLTVLWLRAKSGFARIPGVASALSIFFFAGWRFVIDFFRADPASYVLFSHVVTGTLVVGSIIFLVRQLRINRK